MLRRAAQRLRARHSRENPPAPENRPLQGLEVPRVEPPPDVAREPVERRAVHPLDEATPTRDDDGAIASMLGGMVTCLAWSRLGSPYSLGLDPAEAGVLVSAAMMFAVSLLTSPASEGTLRRFFDREPAADHRA